MSRLLGSYLSWTGAEVIIMAQVIEFYIPESFRRKVKWIPAERRGMLIEFPRSVKKSA